MRKLEFARHLRRDATEAENKLWYHLRDRRLGGLKFRRQVPIGPYIVDFLCKSQRLAVELDGSQHLLQQTYDAERTECLRRSGVRVLRFWNADVLSDLESVLETIHRETRTPND